MKTYREKAIVLTLDLRQRDNINQGIEEFIEFLKYIESDDTTYLHNEAGICFQKQGKAIACLSGYDFQNNPPLHSLVREGVTVLAEQSHFFHKTLYIVSDSLPEKSQVSRLKNCIAKHALRVLFFEVGRSLFRDFFENHFEVESVKQAKEAIQTDYRKEISIEY